MNRPRTREPLDHDATLSVSTPTPRRTLARRRAQVRFSRVRWGLITDPQTLNVGYQPEQPVPFSHAIQLGN